MGLLEIVHSYKEDIIKLQNDLQNQPLEWRKKQAEVDSLIDSLIKLCWDFEIENQNDEVELYKMKRSISEHLMEFFRQGSLSRKVIEKPYGYHGDFKIIDEIYQNEVRSEGLEACLDAYFLKTPASVATRNRKEDFKLYLKEAIENTKDEVRIMDLASGPCRDIQELLLQLKKTDRKLIVDCVDHDLHAINYGKELLKDGFEWCDINFIQKNAIRLALSTQIQCVFPSKYDIVFSTGLFDYLDDRVAIPLVRNLKSILKPGGMLIISNYRDKWSNPSRHYMEWGGGWELIYRTEDDFYAIFEQAGFLPDQLSLKYESQKIMQYRFARI